MNRTSLVMAVAALALAGCSNFTEYSGPPEAGLLFVDPNGLELLGSLDGVQGGRALCAGDGSAFFVSSTTGTLYRYSSESMALDTSFVIGPGSSAGYGSMAYVPGSRSVYVIGALGTILEVSAVSGTVLDDFSAGSSPSCIGVSRGTDMLFVTDPLNRRVHGVRTTDNKLLKTWLLLRTPTVFSNNTMGSDTLLIATNDSKGIAYMQPADYGSPARQVALPPATDFAISEFHDLIFAAHPRYGNPTGSVSVIDSLFPALSVMNTITVPGDPSHLVTHDDGMHLFILSSRESGGCTLYSYHLTHSALVYSTDLPGTPVDMTMAGNRLVILTY